MGWWVKLMGLVIGGGVYHAVRDQLAMHGGGASYTRRGGAGRAGESLLTAVLWFAARVPQSTSPETWGPPNPSLLDSSSSSAAAAAAAAFFYTLLCLLPCQ